MLWELIALLDSDTTPDRALDEAISRWIVPNWPNEGDGDAYARWTRSHGEHGALLLETFSGRALQCFRAAEYTGSLDAALTLFGLAPDMVHSNPRKAAAAALKARAAGQIEVAFDTEQTK